MSFLDREEVVEAAGIRVVSIMRNEFDVMEWQSVADEGYWIGLMLSGSIETCHQHIGKQVWSKDTKHSFWSSGDLVTEHRVLSNRESLAAVFIHLSPKSAGDLFNGEEMEALRQCGSNPLKLSTTPSERAIAWRILGTKAVGLERKLYVVSRAIDLASHAIASFYRSMQTSVESDASIKLSPAEVERIYALAQQLTDKPLSSELLVQRMGMNSRKINMGFRALFGVSMHGFVKRSKLESARALLESGRYNVAQAASVIGYSPAHFSTAFKQLYGHPPSVYRNT